MDWSQSTFLNLCIQNKELFGVSKDLDMSLLINIEQMFDYKMYAFKETDNVKQLKFKYKFIYALLQQNTNKVEINEK